MIDARQWDARSRYVCESSVLDLELATLTDLSTNFVGTGPFPERPNDAVVEGGRVLLTDDVGHRILSIDLVTGDRTVAVDAATGAGPVLQRPTALAVDGVPCSFSISSRTPSTSWPRPATGRCARPRRSEPDLT